jgi:hypothetical protein
VVASAAASSTVGGNDSVALGGEAQREFVGHLRLPHGLLLASPDADFITGQTIDIDGGKSMLQWHREWPTAGVFATVTSTERRFVGTVVRARRRIEDASVAAY